MRSRLLVLLLPALIAGCAARINPVMIQRSISDAQSALKEAEDAGASEYAYAEYTRAKQFLDEALKTSDPVRRLDLARKASLHAKIAEAKSRYLSAQERLDGIKSERVKLLIDKMAEQVAEAQARRSIAEYKMRKAEERARIAQEEAAEAEAKAEAAQREMLRRIAQGKAELAIAKAELAQGVAQDVGAERYAADLYGQASVKLDAAKEALASERFDDAVKFASEAEAKFKEARNSAMTLAKAQKRKVELSQQQLYSEAFASIGRAELLLQMARSFNVQKFAPQKLKDARLKLDKAKKAISERKYDEARNIALEAEKSALAAQKLAQIRWREEQISLSGEELEALAKDAVFKAKTSMDENPDLKKLSPDLYRAADDLLSQAEKAIEERDYQSALVFGSQAAALIENARRRWTELEKKESEMISKLSKIDRFQVLRDSKGILVRISGDLFAPGGSNINSKYRGSLRKLAEVLKGYPQFTVLIEGHTDSIGEAEDNLKLSIARAVKFRDFLVKQGVEGPRLIPIGYGESRPIASNINEAGRRKNRRIDLIILTRSSL
ncbi:OmpA family protein [Candidatus Poribacteria bacterium]|nr:OmpA family protein [Candidatus Poribacteria bacterium]